MAADNRPNVIENSGVMLYFFNGKLANWFSDSKELPALGPGATNTMHRINENSCVSGTIIVNREGFPETTTLDSLTAATYSTHMRNLSHHAANALKEIDVTDDLVVLRLVSKKTEAVVAPDEEFHLIVVMRRQVKHT